MTIGSRDLALVKHDAAGRPLHPLGRTGIAGRGALGHWGPNAMVVGVVTRESGATDGLEILLGAPEGSDTLVLPRVFVRSGEDAHTALTRAVEAGAGWHLDVSGQVLSEGYDYDARRTDHAWITTSVRHVHVTAADAPEFFRPGPGFDSVSWYPLEAPTINRIPANLARHARAAVRALGTEGRMSEPAVSAILAATG
jgi:ADP-ribose pyrophosphatase